MGDAPDKPNPQGFLHLASKLCRDNLGHNNIPVAYVGDTIADINTVNNAKKRIPNQNFISIGIAPPHLHLKSRINDRNSYELKLREAGADLILNKVNDLKNIDINFFKNKNI